jgi:hypothetical protein
MWLVLPYFYPQVHVPIREIMDNVFGANKSSRTGIMSIYVYIQEQYIDMYLRIFYIIFFKGTVSPDIELYFRYLKIKSVLSAVPFIVFTLFYFVVPEIFQK